MLKFRSFIERVFPRVQCAGTLPHWPPDISSGLSESDIENCYLSIIGHCMQRLLVPKSSIDVKVQRTGIASNGLTSFSGYIRVLRWDPVLTPVILQNIPVIEARVRDVAAASVMLQHTDFSGLWFQASSNIVGSPKVLMGLPAQVFQWQGGPRPPEPLTT